VVNTTASHFSHDIIALTPIDYQPEKCRNCRDDIKNAEIYGPERASQNRS
jgi:hypothetical protein